MVDWVGRLGRARKSQAAIHDRNALASMFSRQRKTRGLRVGEYTAGPRDVEEAGGRLPRADKDNSSHREEFLLRYKDFCIDPRSGPTAGRGTESLAGLSFFMTRILHRTAKVDSTVLQCMHEAATRPSQKRS